MQATDLHLLRWTLAVIWLVTAALSFGLYPMEGSLELLQRLPFERSVKVLIVYAGASLDLLMGMLTLVWPRRWVWLSQFAVVAGYSVLSIALVPALWLHPFGPLLKNAAVLAIIWLLYRHAETGVNGHELSRL